MALTDTTRPSFFGAIADNINGAFLASNPRTVTLSDGSRVIVSMKNPPPAGELYYLEASRRQIALRAEEYKRQLTNQEQLNIVDAMRQVAGLDPIQFKTDQYGAAYNNPVPASTTTIGALGERLTGVFTGTTDVVADAEKFYGNLADNLNDAAGRAKDNATLFVIGGLLALWLVAKGRV